LIIFHPWSHRGS